MFVMATHVLSGASLQSALQLQKSMQRPAFSQSPKRVGSGPSRPPISRGFVALADGEPAAATSVVLSADSGRAFVSTPGPDDDGGEPLDMAASVPEPHRGGNGARFVCGEA